MVSFHLWLTAALIGLAIDVGRYKDGDKLLEKSMEDGKRGGNLIVVLLLLHFLFRVLRRRSEVGEKHLGAEVEEVQKIHREVFDLNNNEKIPTGLFRSKLDWEFKNSAKPRESGRNGERFQKPLDDGDIEQKAFWISTISIPMEDFQPGVHYASHFCLLRAQTAEQ